MEMTGNSFKFGLDIIDHVIVEALRQALENVMPDIMIDNNLQERNGYGQFRWNAIIAQLREKCQHLGWLDLGICKPRGVEDSRFVSSCLTQPIYLDDRGNICGSPTQKGKGQALSVRGSKL